MPTGHRLLLVDALNLIRRVHAAQDDNDGDADARTREGLESAGRSLRRAVLEAEPTHAVAVFDGRGVTWRHELLPSYKSGRPPMPEELAGALPAYRATFREIGVECFERRDTEADDVIATLAAKVAASGGDALILATDKGYLQLLPLGVRVRDHFRQMDLGPGFVRDRFGVGPELLVDLFALAGDTTTSIPGVPGVGVKTAATLLEAHGSIDPILAAARAQHEGAPRPPGDPITPRLAERLSTHAEGVALSRRLVELKTDLELGLNLRELRLRR